MLKQTIIRRKRPIILLFDNMLLHKHLTHNSLIGEVSLVLINGDIKYMERNIRSGIAHSNYFELKYLVEKLKPTDIYLEKEIVKEENHGK